MIALSFLTCKQQRHGNRLPRRFRTWRARTWPPLPHLAVSDDAEEPHEKALVVSNQSSDSELAQRTVVSRGGMEREWLRWLVARQRYARQHDTIAGGGESRRLRGLRRRWRCSARTRLTSAATKVKAVEAVSSGAVCRWVPDGLRRGVSTGALARHQTEQAQGGRRRAGALAGLAAAAPSAPCSPRCPTGSRMRCCECVVEHGAGTELRLDATWADQGRRCSCRELAEGQELSGQWTVDEGTRAIAVARTAAPDRNVSEQITARA